MNKTFIFDYDDTLAWCEHDYCYAIIDFLKFTIDKLGHKAPDVQSIMELEMGLNKQGVLKHGFKGDVFPASCRDAYRIICERAGVEDKQGEEEAYNIGMRAFDEKRYRERGLVEGAAETLEFLVSQRDELILLTKGDREIQQKKIEATGLWRYFRVDAINIVEKKNADTIRDVIAGRDKSRVWHVGNSIRSDVNPALEAGINVIYIPCETWAYEREHNGVPDDSRITTFSSITGIKENYHLL
ncbi:MAG: HAD family hydrolase [Candidatus Nanoarchaeia archaeon]|nr:HAD family hydrolase [Candidatus Nanoarchaeia archaeon]